MWQLAANEWQILSIRDDAWLGECWANATLLGRASILPLHLGIRSGGKILSEQLLIPFSGRNLWPIGERGMGMRGDWGAHYGAGVGNRVLFLAGCLSQSFPGSSPLAFSHLLCAWGFCCLSIAEEIWVEAEILNISKEKGDVLAESQYPILALVHYG